jgi:DNA ligase-1
MSKRWEPGLSAKVYVGTKEKTQQNLDLIQFPALVSTKWDGWRMFEKDGEATCRSMDPPKNRYVQKRLREFYAAAAALGIRNLDGEIMVGDPYSKNVMQATTSGVGSYEGEPDFVYYLFDTYQHPEDIFTDRLSVVRQIVERLEGKFPFIRYTDHVLVHNMEQLMEKLRKVVEAGGEGVMGRKPDGPYHHGRPSMKSNILWALKPYVDDDQRYVQASGHKENLVGKGTFGKAICRSPRFKETFSVGAGVGLTAALRKYIWKHPEEFVGGTLKYKYQEIGVKDRPRQPKWMGMKAKEDMG